jgi:hypothetical protein
MSVSYKSFDSANIFFSNLWELFPSFYGESKSSDVHGDIKNYIVRPIRESSFEFCDLLDSGKVYVEEFAKGGFGVVGGMKINEDQEGQDIHAISVSLKPNGGFEPFYVPIILKRGTKSTEINWMYETKKIGSKTVTRFGISDPITEVIFGSMLGHLYDLGLCPFYSKYFGIFSCPLEDKETISIVTERSNKEVLGLLERKGGENPWYLAIKKDPNVLINVLFQFIYSMYISKKYIGFAHLDAHHRNVMVTYTDRRLVDDEEMKTIPYIYHGINMEKKDYILIDLGFKINKKPAYIAMKYNGIMAKLIDYGSCAAFLFRSETERYNKDLILSADNETYGSFNAGHQAFENCTKSSSYCNTVELQFLLLNLHQLMQKGLDVSADTPDLDKNAPKDYKSILKALNEFAEYFYDDESYGDLDSYTKKNPDKVVNKTKEKTWRWFMRNRDVGLKMKKFEKASGLLEGLVRYCQSLGHKKYEKLNLKRDKGENVTLFYLESDLKDATFTKSNTLLLSENNTSYSEKMNQMVSFLEYQNVVEESCETDRNEAGIFESENTPLRDRTSRKKDELCSKYRNLRDKYDPKTVTSKRLYSSNTQSPGYDRKMGNFEGFLNERNFPYLRLYYDPLGLFVGNIQINPKALNMDPSKEGSLFYRRHENWMDYEDIENELDGNPIEFVNVNVVAIKPEENYNVELNHSKGLWESSVENFRGVDSGVTINGGYFIVGTNLSELTSHIIDESNIENKNPIGYCFDHHKIGKKSNGTHLPIPKAYRKYFGVVWCDNGNVIHIDRYEDFIDRHDTINQEVRYMMNDGSIYSTTQKVIKMRNDDGKFGYFGDYPVGSDGLMIGDYKWAFCSGPMMVWDEKVVFTDDVMLNSQFHIVDSDVSIDPKVEKPKNFTTYSLSPKSPNNYMFKGSSSGDSTTPYGSRHSNRFMIHNVMGITEDMTLMFFLIEGRGYDAPGLDRVQVAHLISKFKVVKAISLDGGFSANSVFKVNGGKLHYLQKDPEKRELGISVSFGMGSAIKLKRPKYPATLKSL